MPSTQSSARFEDTLTWDEANWLRSLVSDARRAARGELLLVEDEGAPASDPRARIARARFERFERLEAKILTLFYRMSDGT
jgi:hypothetical protein